MKKLLVIILATVSCVVIAIIVVFSCRKPETIDTLLYNAEILSFPKKQFSTTQAQIDWLNDSYNKKIKLYQRALQLAAKDLGMESLKYKEIEYKLAFTYFLKHDFEKAVPLYLDVLKVENNQGIMLGIAIKHSNFDLAKIYDDREEDASAERYYKEALQLAQQDTKDSIFPYNVLHDFIAFQIKKKNYDEAQKLLVDLKGLVDEEYSLKKDDLQRALKYKVIEGLYKKMGMDNKVNELQPQVSESETKLANESEKSRESQSELISSILGSLIVPKEKYLIMQAVSSSQNSDLIYEARDTQGEKIFLEKSEILNLNDILINDVKAGPTGIGINVILPLSADGQKKLRVWTKDNIGARMAILINGKVVAAPMIREEFSGPLSLTIFDTLENAKKFIDILKTLNGV